MKTVKQLMEEYLEHPEILEDVHDFMDGCCRLHCATFGERMNDNTIPTGDDRKLVERTLMVLGTLTPRERKVMRMRFGIPPLPESRRYTLEEIGKQFEVTRDRIRWIEAKALRKLRHPSRSKLLRPDLLPDDGADVDAHIQDIREKFGERVVRIRRVEGSE